MKWRGRRGSRNIDDRRGGGGFGGGGLGGMLARGGGRGGGRRAGLGIFGVLAVVVIGAVFGIDTSFLLGGGGSGLQTAPAPQSGPNRIDDESEEFVSVVLADTEEVWTEIFSNRLDKRYQPPTLVLFSGAVRSACGAATSASGPFYCPGDNQVYLDTSFFATLERQLGARGDFARAYVIAHEVAHHVQNMLGVLPEVNRARAEASEVESNLLSVRVELQADCFSGVWARKAEARFGALEPGDIDEAMNAAAQIGDDALQRRSQGQVVPDSFTHGTSEQRVRWFSEGYSTADIAACDTFAADRL